MYTRLNNNFFKSILKTSKSGIKNIVDFRFQDSSFEATIDDVMDMTHQKIILDYIWNQYFIIRLSKR